MTGPGSHSRLHGVHAECTGQVPRVCECVPLHADDACMLGVHAECAGQVPRVCVSVCLFMQTTHDMLGVHAECAGQVPCVRHIVHAVLGGQPNNFGWPPTRTKKSRTFGTSLGIFIRPTLESGKIVAAPGRETHIKNWYFQATPPLGPGKVSQALLIGQNVWPSTDTTTLFNIERLILTNTAASTVFDVGFTAGAATFFLDSKVVVHTPQLHTLARRTLIE